MRCLTKSLHHGRCVLDTHFTGSHVNSHGVRFADGQRKNNSGVHYLYLNTMQAAELKAEAEAKGKSPGAIIKELVLEHLGLS